MRVELRVTDGGSGIHIPQPTEWQRIGNEIEGPIYVCAVAPKAENLSMATADAHIRADFAGDLQPNPSDSPEFTPWGPED